MQSRHEANLLDNLTTSRNLPNRYQRRYRTEGTRSPHMKLDVLPFSAASHPSFFHFPPNSVLRAIKALPHWLPKKQPLNNAVHTTIKADKQETKIGLACQAQLLFVRQRGLCSPLVGTKYEVHVGTKKRRQWQPQDAFMTKAVAV